jgi:hypothetical protein
MLAILRVYCLFCRFFPGIVRHQPQNEKLNHCEQLDFFLPMFHNYDHITFFGHKVYWIVIGWMPEAERERVIGKARRRRGVRWREIEARGAGEAYPGRGNEAFAKMGLSQNNIRGYCA